MKAKKPKKILTWEDTVLRNIKWKSPQTTIKDGRLDFDIHLPLTELFRQQARQSFMTGIAQALVFIGEHKRDMPITGAELKAQMERWGLKEFWDAVKAKSNEGSR